MEHEELGCPGDAICHYYFILWPFCIIGLRRCPIWVWLIRDTGAGTVKICTYSSENGVISDSVPRLCIDFDHFWKYVIGFSLMWLLVVGIAAKNTPRLLRGVENTDLTAIYEKKCV
jgi:hypothetical protein